MPSDLAATRPYESDLKNLIAAREAGASFPKALAIVDGALAASDLKRQIIGVAGARTHEGVDLCKLPLCGAHTDVIVDLAGANYRSVVRWCVDPEIDSGADLVLEIGCGRGDVIASIAHDYRNRPISFVASDFHQTAVDCALELSKISGSNNITGCTIDVENPDLSFAAPKRPVIIGCSVFSAVAKPEIFLDALINWSGDFTFCAFETFVHPKDRSGQTRGIEKNPFWYAVKAYAASGRLKAERVISNMVGKSPSWPLSFVKIRPGS